MVRCPLARWELRLHYAIWIAHSIAAFVTAAYASKKLESWLSHHLRPSPYAPQGWQMDFADTEWWLFRRVFVNYLLTFTIHSCIFATVQRHLTRKEGQITLIAFWLALHWHWTSWRSMALRAVVAVASPAITYWSGKQTFAWIIAIVFVMNVTSWAPYDDSPEVYYREFIAYMYSALQILNFCIHINRHPPAQFTRELVISYLEYLLYPAYSFSLIVLYPDFTAQMHSMRARVEAGQPTRPPPRAMAWKAARLLFWFFFMEAALHFLRVNAIFNTQPSLLRGLNNYELASVAYVAGQLFHLKYTVIFGLPAFFAELDGLTPPGPPICISRVSKYSHMWRHFDRGLYAFLKHQLYLPLMGSHGANPWQRFAAMVAVFLFVLAWHGVIWSFAYWVLLSAIEICIERLGSDCLSNTNWYLSLKARLSPAALWRLNAVAMVATVIPGIFGVFFFLSRHSGVGAYIFEQCLMVGGWQLVTGQWSLAGPGWVLAHMLLMLGPAFNSVCLALEEERCERKDKRNGDKERKE